MSWLEQLSNAVATADDDDDEEDEDYVPPPAEMEALEAELAKQEAAIGSTSAEANVEDTEVKSEKKESLWKSFLDDVGPRKKTIKFPTKPVDDVSDIFSSFKPKSIKPEDTSKKDSPKPNTVEIKKVFDFAGEKVVVRKTVQADSKEAIDFSELEKTSDDESPSSQSSGSERAVDSVTTLKRPLPGSSGSNLSSIVGQLGKKTKMGTLQKSSIDWQQFKQTEGLEEELASHRKGKDSYLDKKDFLQKVDWAQFEKEKSMRDKTRSLQGKT